MDGHRKGGRGTAEGCGVDEAEGAGPTPMPAFGLGGTGGAKTPQLLLCWKVRLQHQEDAFLRRLGAHFVLQEVSHEVLAACSGDIDPRCQRSGSESSDGGMGALFHSEQDEVVRLVFGTLR